MLFRSVRKELAVKTPLKPCPHCKAEKPYKRGLYKEVQCYTCRNCHRNYRETTGTALYHLHKRDKLQSYLEEMKKGTSIKKTAKIVGISIQTSFDWRHKILSSTAEHLHQKLGGEVQCDEMEIAQSNKGDRNLLRPARKRGNDFKRNNKTRRKSKTSIFK